MFKVLDPKYFALAVAWAAVLILTGINAAKPFLQAYGIAPALSWTVFLVQGLVTILFVTRAWRWVWKRCPPLNRWVYPDLNGEWDVVGETNWDRIDAILKAANREIPRLNMRVADEHQLPPLGRTLMRARITQTWLKITMVLWNPTAQGPIKESRTLTVEPFRGEDGRHGLVYVFEQENSSPVVSDDRLFYGAARVVQDRDDPNVLCGRMWTDRMWRRGMNTAADIRLTRR